MLNPLYAESIRVDEEGPDGTFLTIKTEEIGTIQVNIQDIVLEFEAEVYNKLHAYALEAAHARAAVARGTSLSEYLDDGVVRLSDEWSKDAYALDDPKHPTYHDRMSIAADWKDAQVRSLRGEA